MKRFDSPVKKWPGHVLLHDPIPLIKIAAFQVAVADIRKNKSSGDAVTQSILLPALIPCVAEWHLEGFPEPVTVENFPGTPRDQSSILVSNLVTAIMQIYKGDEDSSPNA
jgi:hypothetical protein